MNYLKTIPEDNIYSDTIQEDNMNLYEHTLSIGYIDNIYRNVNIPCMNSFIDYIIDIWYAIYSSGTEKKYDSNTINYNDELYFHPLYT